MSNTPNDPLENLVLGADEVRALELEELEPMPAPAGPGPRARVVRTAIQALLGLLASIPAAWAALQAAGVDVDAEVTALVLGIPAALFVVVSAVWNAVDSRRGLA
jgi:hypothetical protein